jgi:hypothetical protein
LALVYHIFISLPHTTILLLAKQKLVILILLMKKTDTPMDRIVANFKSLIPYVGALLVTAGIIGLVFVQQPLQTSQDLRGDAEELLTFPGIKEELRVPFVVNKTGELAFYLHQENYVFQKIYVVFSIENRYLDTPEIIVNLGSGFEAESVEVEQTSSGYLVSVVAIPNNIDWFVPPADTSLLRIKLVPRQPGSVAFIFDPDKTYAETLNLNVVLSIPDKLEYEIMGSGSSPTPTPTPTPPGGTPTPTPPGGTPTPTPPIILGCNETCSSNADCAVNLRCYNTGSGNYCRLATNPVSTTCQAGTTDGTVSCNQYCTANSQCQSGLTCWNSFCRNPENPESTQCSAPTTDQTNQIINSCNESCSSNAECAINLRCYEGQCRLATNPSSTSCSAVTKQTVSTTYSKKSSTATTTAELKDSDTPLLKGDNVIPDKNVVFEDQSKSEADRLALDDSFDADETVFDLIKNLITNSESRLPLFITLFGIILLVLSIFAAVMNRIRNSDNYVAPQPSSHRKIDVDSYNVKSKLENQPKD